jgi:hypothetical protein
MAAFLYVTEGFSEAGVGGINASGIFDDGLAFGKKAGDREGHGDAVIAVARERGAFER